MDKKILHLSKRLILNLPVFMDTAVKSLTSFTGLEAKKQSHAVKEFDITLDGDFIVATMKFKGGIEGIFILIFPLDMAVITIESLLGEKVNIKDFDTLKDGVGEFCNIIMGSIKTVLSKENISITFSLPKTYTSLASAKVNLEEDNGIWVDMLLSKVPFYMFIGK